MTQHGWPAIADTGAGWDARAEMKHRSGLHLACLAIVALVLVAQLFVPTMVGLADDGDFRRVMRWGGIEHTATDPALRYWSWIERTFVVDPLQAVIGVGFPSSEGLVVKTVALAELPWLGKRFDLRGLTILHIGLLLFGLALLLRSWTGRSRFFPLLLTAAFTLVFCDIAYALYLQSFYSEAASLIFLITTVGAGLHLVEGQLERRRLLIFFAAAALFLVAKPQNIPFVILLAPFCAFLAKLAEPRERVAIRGGAAALVVVAAAGFFATPHYALDPNKYNGVFMGVLKDSPNPAGDLDELGLDPRLASLAGTEYWSSQSDEVHGQWFREAFFNRVSHAKIGWFYARHPARLLLRLRAAAKVSGNLQLDLGNFEHSSGKPARAKVQRLNAWSRAKASGGPRSLLALACGWLLLLAGVLVATRERIQRLFLLMLWAMLPMALVLPVVGEGEADLAKHMFGFSALADLLIVLVGTVLVERAAIALWGKAVSARRG
jgi:hypothetical protein